ncbi:pentatricopeptide repeat-containing protein, partial [Tanacetum coccineum]
KKAFREIDDVFVRMRREGEFASYHVLSEVVRVYSQCGLVDKGLEFYKVYDEMLERSNASGSGADNYSTCIMVSAFCKIGKVEEGRKLIVDRWGEGCDTNVGFLPAVETYGAMINGFYKDGNFGIVERLMNEVCGEKPDLLTYQSLIHGIVVLGEDLYQIFLPDKFIYATLIDGFVRNEELDEAKKLFEHAIQKGVKLDVVGYNAIIKGYCKNVMIKDAVSCVNTMIKARIFSDEFIYSTIIDGYVKQHDMDGALGIFSQMVKQNCKPNVVTYTSLIKGFCQKGDTISAEKFLKEMKFRGLMPNVVTYSILLGSYCKIGNLSKAASFFEQTLMNKCNPNDVTFHYLVNGFREYEKSKEINEDKNSMFLDINRKMILDGWSPRVAVYSTIVVCLCLHGMLSISLQLSDKMAIKDCPIVFAALLYGIYLEGRAKEWNSIISCNLNEPELLVAVKYTSFFQQYRPQGAISEASLILQGLVEECKFKHHKTVEIL